MNPLSGRMRSASVIVRRYSSSRCNRRKQVPDGATMSPRFSKARSTAAATVPLKKSRPRIRCTAPNLRSEVGDRKSEIRVSAFQRFLSACYSARVLDSATNERQGATRFQLGAAGLALLALWFLLCRHLSGEWWVNEQYSYGWFVPFFA